MIRVRTARMGLEATVDEAISHLTEVAREFDAQRLNHLSVVQWAAQTVVLRYMTFLKREAKFYQRRAPEPPEDFQSAVEPDPPQIRLVDDRDAVESCLKILSDEDRAIIERIYFQGEMCKTLAEERGVNQSTISQRLIRIRRDLQAHLATSGV